VGPPPWKEEHVVVSVRIESVSKAYGPVRAVDDVSLTVEKGSIVGVIGYSGAGKSTLVRLINGLERPTAGRVFVGDDEITALTERQLRSVRRGIGMIFQQFNLFRSRTVAGNVAYPLRVAGMPRAERDARVARLLDFVGLLEKAHAYPEQLSGGQKQRVGIARALATDPHLLLADEATSALDPETTADVLALLRRVNRELGITIVLITHEMEAAGWSSTAPCTTCSRPPPPPPPRASCAARCTTARARPCWSGSAARTAAASSPSP
jgi:D-methionine transport system ATP-binding protein